MRIYDSGPVCRTPTFNNKITTMKSIQTKSFASCPVFVSLMLAHVSFAQDQELAKAFQNAEADLTSSFEAAYSQMEIENVESKIEQMEDQLEDLYEQDEDAESSNEELNDEINGLYAPFTVETQEEYFHKKTREDWDWQDRRAKEIEEWKSKRLPFDQHPDVKMTKTLTGVSDVLLVSPSLAREVDLAMERNDNRARARELLKGTGLEPSEYIDMNQDVPDMPTTGEIKSYYLKSGVNSELNKLEAELQQMTSAAKSK